MVRAMQEPRQKALLVNVQLPTDSDADTQASLAELSRLVDTLGYQVVAKTSQKRKSQRGANVLGDGKLKDVARWTGGPGEVGKLFVRKKHKAALKFDPQNEDGAADSDAGTDLDEATDDATEDADFDSGSDSDLNTRVDRDFDPEFASEAEVAGSNEDSADSSAPESAPEPVDVVIFDCDLSPSQLRNLEKALAVTVLDRTGVIIEIFSRHARTRAAKLQVEIARLTYVAPRLRETGGNEDRGSGGIGGKGAGESSLELDRRKIRDRIKELKEELDSISQEHETRRSRRSQDLSVALVGYTNAGKSSLMRALTGSEVLVADQLFATLDTTVRQLYPASIPRILISDTVGFIKKLPHDLVASFKSTLDEALSASLLLFVVDSSDPDFRSQLAVTRQVLGEVGAGEIDHWLVLNKVDRLSEEERHHLQAEFPGAVFLSTRRAEDVADFRLKLINHFESDMQDFEILIPYTVKLAVGDLRNQMRVLSETYTENGFVFRVRAEPSVFARFKARHQL